MKTFHFFDKELPLTPEVQDCFSIYDAYATLTPTQARIFDRFGEEWSSALADLREAIYQLYMADQLPLSDDEYDGCVDRLDEVWDAEAVIDDLREIVELD